MDYLILISCWNVCDFQGYFGWSNSLRTRRFDKTWIVKTWIHRGKRLWWSQNDEQATQEENVFLRCCIPWKCEGFVAIALLGLAIWLAKSSHCCFYAFKSTLIVSTWCYSVTQAWLQWNNATSKDYVVVPFEELSLPTKVEAKLWAESGSCWWSKKKSKASTRNRNTLKYDNTTRYENQSSSIALYPVCIDH